MVCSDFSLDSEDALHAKQMLNNKDTRDPKLI